MLPRNILVIINSIVLVSAVQRKDAGDTLIALLIVLNHIIHML